MQNISKQYGFTLIELMIALMLGLFLSGGALMMYVANHNTYGTIVDNSRLQESARYAQIFLEENIRLSGWKVEPKEIELPSLNTTTAVAGKRPAWNNGVFILGNNNQTADIGNLKIKNKTDLLYIRYQGSGDGVSGDSTISDCLGNTYSKTHEVTEIFYIDDENNLNCKVSSYEVATPATITEQDPVKLVSGIESMQLLFGVDRTSNSVPNRYFTANQVSAVEWSNVVSIKVSLLVTSNQASANANNKDATGSINKFDLLDEEDIELSDSKLYAQVFTTTIALRNSRP